MITHLNVYILRDKNDPKFEVTTHGRTLADAMENCSGGAKRWKLVRTETKPYLHAALMHDIAAALPGAWSAEPISYEHADCNWHLVRNDGLKLFVSMPNYNHKHSLEIRLSAPSRNGRYIDVYDGGTRVPAPSIGVGQTKTPAQIAKDIARRLLPDAEKYQAALLEKIWAYDQAEAEQLQTYRDLCAILRVTPREQKPGDPRTSSYFEGGQFDVNPGGSASFQIRSVPADKAAEIARAIAGLLAK